MFSELIDVDMPGYTTADIAGNEVVGLLTRIYVETTRISGNRPVFTVSSDETIVVGDNVEIEERNYRVAELQPDGDGFIEVILEDV